jgi:hypothetical protein
VLDEDALRLWPGDLELGDLRASVEHALDTKEAGTHDEIDVLLFEGDLLVLDRLCGDGGGEVEEVGAEELLELVLVVRAAVVELRPR